MFRRTTIAETRAIFLARSAFLLRLFALSKVHRRWIQKASKEYELLRDSLLFRLQSPLPRDERVKTHGLLAETYCQLANVFAHRLASLRPRDRTPAEVQARKPKADSYRRDASQYSQKAEDIVESQ